MATIIKSAVATARRAERIRPASGYWARSETPQAPEVQMASIYDTFADSCAALAARSKRESDRVQLLQLADRWRTVPADRQGPGKKPLTPVPSTDGSVDRSDAVAPGTPWPCVQAEIGRRQDKRSTETTRKQAQTGQGRRPRQGPRGDRGYCESLKLMTMRSLTSSDSEPSARKKKGRDRSKAAAGGSLSYRSRTDFLRARHEAVDRFGESIVVAVGDAGRRS